MMDRTEDQSSVRRITRLRRSRKSRSLHVASALEISGRLMS